MPRLLLALSLLVLVPGSGAGLSGAAAQDAADPSALFERGATWSDFLANANAQRERWQTNTARAAPRAEFVTRLKAVAADLRILAIAEAACSDSVSTIPYLAKLAAEAGVELRIVARDLGRPVMEQNRTPDGRAATPTIVLLRAGRVAGVWVERPRALQDWFLSAPIQALPQGERISRKMSWYDWDRGDATLAEIVALAERTAGEARRGPDALGTSARFAAALRR